MSPLRCLMLVFGIFSGASSYGQFFVMTGYTRSVEGPSLAHFEPGDPIQLSLDIKHAVISPLGVTNAHEAFYFIPTTMLVGGASLLPLHTSTLIILTADALSITGPYRWDGIDLMFPGKGGSYIFGVALVTKQHVLSTPTFLPPGIPMTAFDSAFRGYADYPALDGGHLGFSVTGYHYQNAQITAVPEPATYGAFAVFGLLGLVVLRRFCGDSAA